jgi:hypothetical protein
VSAGLPARILMCRAHWQCVSGRTARRLRAAWRAVLADPRNLAVVRRHRHVREQAIAEAALGAAPAARVSERVAARREEMHEEAPS